MKNFLRRSVLVEVKEQNYDFNVKFFNKIKKELESKLTNIFSIEHVGSTAVPNMCGKNILDENRAVVKVQTGFIGRNDLEEIEEDSYDMGR